MNALKIAERIHSVATDGRHAAESLLTDPSAMAAGQASNVPHMATSEDQLQNEAVEDGIIQKIWKGLKGAISKIILSDQDNEVQHFKDAIPILSRPQLECVRLELMRQTNRQGKAAEHSRFLISVANIDFVNTDESGVYFISIGDTTFIHTFICTVFP
eukprot:Gregarina_sp_Poly_1__306@NODE_1075_length_5172_cov_40_719491_g538_i1_p6_GENE_NODE_1075_length_5172_cov_40_719491_g538_i1NODE_1075_length_5172_cov_40_719491_g538_i1_p6_ORF_typecomplete_len158_score27_86_NODE_1075_length_5172_cov_40_719491_g538_i145475020